MQTQAMVVGQRRIELSMRIASLEGPRRADLSGDAMKQPHEMRPGNRYAWQAEARRTLGNLIASKSALVAICQRCKHRRLLFPGVLASRLGENFLVLDLPQHLRCGRCNGNATAKVYESSR